MMSFIFGFIMGGSLCGWLAWELKKDATTTVIKDLTIQIDKEDLISLIESDNEVDKLIEKSLKKL